MNSAPLEEAWTLPASWYVDVAHYRREVSGPLSNAWHYVCSTSSLSERGAFHTFDLLGEPLVLVRGDDDVIRAFFNVCRHRAGQVAKGDVDGRGCAPSLRCHYHGWTYALDGKLCGAPEMQEARNFDMAAFALRSVRCETRGKLVFVSLHQHGPALSDVLGAQGEMLDVVDAPFHSRQVWDIACNWKVYVDNFLEGYHVPRAHASLHALLDYRQYVVEPAGHCVVQRAPAREKGALPSAYLWMFPGFMLNVTPQYAQTNAIMPVGVDKTRVVFDFFFAPSVKKKQREAALKLSDEIQREDLELCETVQRNLRSRSYDAGRYCPRRENGVHHFHELMRGALDAHD